MKTISSKKWLAVCVSVLTAAAALRAPADQSLTNQAVTTARPERSYTGTIIAVDPKEHTLTVQEWAMFKRSFTLGDNCAISQLGNDNATVADLRPGEKAMVNYQDANGVLIADRIEQIPMSYEGMVKAVDPAKQTMTLSESGFDRQLKIADDCKIVLRDDKPGTFADVKVGDHVTVTYEAPGSTPVARQIAQTSMEFTGSLTAIDLDEKTVKAKSLFASKEFHVANNCAVVINGNPDGQLADLKPDEKLVFSYDDINGVNVVNRIASADEVQPNSTNSAAANPPPMAGN
jgi:hypothetical protein